MWEVIIDGIIVLLVLIGTCAALGFAYRKEEEE